jgi:hypothetical protein
VNLSAVSKGFKMSDDAKEFFTKYEGLFAKVKATAPNTVSGFGGMFAKIMGDGALNGLQKEFVALGIGVAAHASRVSGACQEMPRCGAPAADHGSGIVA